MLLYFKESTRKKIDKVVLGVAVFGTLNAVTITILNYLQ